MKKLMMIAALVLGGMVACNLASAQDAGKEGKKGKMPSVQERLDRLSDELKLTDEQKPKVKAVLEEQQKAMEAARSATDPTEGRQKFRDAMQEGNKKMKDILTPEQYEKYSTAMKNKRGGKGGGKGGDKKGDTKT